MSLEGLPTPDLLLPDEAPPALPSFATPQDLEAHPGLAQLLKNLGASLGRDGLSPHLQKELQQAEESLNHSRRIWLQWEVVWRILEELLRDPRDFDPSVLQRLEQELIWAQVRQGPPEIAQLVPPPQASSLLPLLLPELERRLMEKQDELLSYLLGPPKTSPGPSGDTSEPPQTSPNLRVVVEAQRIRLLQARLRNQTLKENLERQSWVYPEVLGRVHSLLSHLESLRGAQEQLDQAQGSYLEAKGTALLLKIRMEELQVLLDSYPAPTLEAHRRIRARLSQSLQEAREEAATLRAELAALQGLGPEFQALAKEYGRIREETERTRFALQTLRKSCP